MAPGQENPLHPATPQGNQTCPTQRQPWRLDTDGGPESDPTPPRLSMGYRTSFRRSLPQFGGLSGNRASSPNPSPASSGLPPLCGSQNPRC